jgi:TonB-dependent receptor
VVGLTNKSVGPNTSVNLQGGDSIQLGEEEIFGLFGAFSQRNDYSTLGDASRVPSFKVENIGGNKVLVPQAETAENRGTQDNLWGTLVNMAYQPAAEQKVAVNFLFNQQASDVADSQQDTTTVPGTIGQYQVINYSQRTLAFLQFNGNHVVAPLGALQVDWVGGVGQSTLSEPDQRIFMNQFTPGTGVYQILGQQNYSPSGTTEPLQRYQRGLTEGNYNFLANLGLPFFPEDKGNPSKFKTGFYIDTSQRQYNQNYFAYNYGDAGNGTYETFGGPTDPSDGNNWSQVFLNENRSGLVNEAGQLGNDQPMSWTIGNFSGNAGNFYNAYQQVLASYTMVEFQLFPQLTLVGGARYENTDLQIRGANNLPNTLFPNPNFSGGGTGLAKIQQLDLLPAVGATFQLMENVNLRFAWSQTLARPSFKEMGPVVTQDFADSAIFLGNPQLQLSFINNYDFRAEYFPRAGEVVAFSLFYKLIDQPIEQTRVAIGTEGTEFFRYINNPSGSLYGAEFEVRKRLDQVASWLKNFSINFNYTYTQSQVQLTPGQIDANQSVGILETSRPLQGQPQYICNAGLSFDDQERGFYAGLFYNVTGQFLYAAGLEVPDIYEQPAPSLDFNLTQRFADQWSFTFRGKNLLNPVFKQTQTYQGTVYDYFQYTKGWDLSLAVNYSF